MSSQDSKVVVRRFLSTVIAARDPQAAAQVLTSDYAVHFVGMPQPITGLSAWQQVIAGYFSAFPDLQLELEEEIAENERVSVRYIWSGTHRGAFMGIPPTGRHVRVAGHSTFRVSADKVAEEWHLEDTLGLLRQLGVAPEPGVAVPA
jgi:steroid delta-isomerase-like uncharacterized protein